MPPLLQDVCDLGSDADLGEVGGVARHEEAHPVVLPRVGGLEQPHSERGTSLNVCLGIRQKMSLYQNKIVTVHGDKTSLVKTLGDFVECLTVLELVGRH